MSDERIINIFEASVHLRDLFRDEIDKICKSCLNCEHFDEKTEMCKAYLKRPPARVIAYGCPRHEGVIPF